ncbi:Sec-independent protein translocase TatC [Anaerobranca californiensis DSM 14826]|uniref:Sec-independent protein translocase protein TatC n=1 Tax=Anaerobranca californiensis DSM 14826 TaxID=1120989 RepID=A0A1M6LKL6_9FIRM|nr:twin-arginine translocase subunit TatC [Anaerobranca californiensis]SHJ71715.1 Sec-independent protein translocase TatC [Anaerobranca californiensis DSM 14826]
MEQYGKMSIIGHLSELRKRIIISFLAFVVGFIISYTFIDEIRSFVLKPAQGLELIYLSPPELFLAYLKIAFITGFILASPVIILQFWLFIKPALKKEEKKHLIFAMIMGLIFFLIGASFAYYVIIPMSINFFVRMSVDDITPMFSVVNYLKFVNSLLLSFGLVFQLPLLIILLSQLNLITPKTLRKYRKFVILAIFTVSAFITPPDIISQVMMAVPMMILYEFSLIASSVIYKRKKNKNK